jgi:hypothetical protein
MVGNDSFGAAITSDGKTLYVGGDRSNIVTPHQHGHERRARRTSSPPRFADGQYFVPLHGHTPGHPATDPADALAGLLPRPRNLMSGKSGDPRRRYGSAEGSGDPT